MNKDDLIEMINLAVEKQHQEIEELDFEEDDQYNDNSSAWDLN